MIGEEARAASYIRGVPHPLPIGETILWEGAPMARAVARHAFYQRALLAYFLAMVLVWAIFTPNALGSSDFLIGLGVRLGLTAAVMTVVEILSIVVARTTWYAITNKRVVLRIGMVIPMSINIPFALLESAGAGSFKDGTGQVTLKMMPGNRLAYIALWPHCRMRNLNNPEPVLRALQAPAAVGGVLADAVAAAASHDVTSRLERGVSPDATADRRLAPQTVVA